MTSLPPLRLLRLAVFLKDLKRKISRDLERGSSNRRLCELERKKSPRRMRSTEVFADFENIKLCGTVRFGGTEKAPKRHRRSTKEAPKKHRILLRNHPLGARFRPVCNTQQTQWFRSKLCITSSNATQGRSFRNQFINVAFIHNFFKRLINLGSSRSIAEAMSLIRSDLQRFVRKQSGLPEQEVSRSPVHRKNV